LPFLMDSSVLKSPAAAPFFVRAGSLWMAVAREVASVVDWWAGFLWDWYLTVGKRDIMGIIFPHIPHYPSWITMTLNIFGTISTSYFWYQSLTWMKYTTSHLWG
jgi:hypothetical protein